MRQPRVLADRPTARHAYVTQPARPRTGPFSSYVRTGLYSPFLKSCHETHRRYLLLMRFTLAEGGLLLLDAGAFLVDVLT